MLDMNSIDFASETLGMEGHKVLQILSSDALQCKDEDQVVDFVKMWLTENRAWEAPADAGVVMAFYDVIRYDFVSTGKLIELTCDPKMNNERVARAMCKRLAEKDSTDLDLPPSIALGESTPRLYKDPSLAGKNAQNEAV